MGDIIAFEDLKKSAEQCEVLALFKGKSSPRANAQKSKRKFEFPSSRPFVSGNLSDLYEHANAVAMRHYEGDAKVPDIVAEKCIELLEALAQHAEPE